MRPAVDYGLDAPIVVGTLGAGGVAALIAGFALGRVALAVAGLSLLLTAVAMAWSSIVGKVRAVETLLSDLGLAGDERLLDVGCGRGLLLVAAAKRLPCGSVVGVDRWRARDQSGNSRAATKANLQRERVADRSTVVDADARQLPFPDDDFDIVVCSLLLHNLSGVAARAAALNEMLRVLRPVGTLGIIDIAHTAEYATVLERAGLDVTRRRTVSIFPPAHIVLAHRPSRHDTRVARSSD